MFPVDTFQAQYLEEREAADTAKRMARLQEQHQQRAQAAALSARLSAHQQQSTCSSSQPQQQQHSSLSQALLQQRPGLSRAGSQTVLGSIFQNFTGSVSSSAASSRSATPAAMTLSPRDSLSGASTPVRTPTTMVSQKELEAALVAEKKRDADIVCFPHARLLSRSIPS